MMSLNQAARPIDHQSIFIKALVTFLDTNLKILNELSGWYDEICIIKSFQHLCSLTNKDLNNGSKIDLGIFIEGKMLILITKIPYIFRLLELKHSNEQQIHGI